MSPALEQRRYKILHVLGKGGFGTVYKARLEAAGGFSKEVALKVLNPELQSDEGVVMRLRDEARMLGLLRHRAIVQVDGLVKLDGRWTIVMEFVSGASLRDLLSLGRTPVSVALETCEEVAAALDMAYAGQAAEGKPLGLLHRDIKPGNVQITDRGEVKLLDFGVAKADFGGREAETRSLIFGSLHYLAPERMDFEDTHKGDVYALACCLYEMLTGEQFEKASINPKKHRAKIDRARRRVIEIHNDPDLAELIERCLEYEPDNRPDARAFERRARAIRRGYPEPWLRDWAETAVPRAQASRSLTEDEWSGSLVNESGVLAQPTLAFFPAESGDVLEEDETLPPPSGASPRTGPPMLAAGAPGTTWIPDELLDDHGAARPSAEPAPNPAPPPREPPAPPKPRLPRRPAPTMAPNPPPAPVPPPIRPPANRLERRSDKPVRRRKGRVGRWLLGIFLTGVFLIIAAAVLIPVIAGTGLWAVLQQSGIVADAWADTVRDNMVELDQQVSVCNATLERDDARAVLRAGHDPDVAQTISLMELVAFEQLVEKATSDRDISMIELDRIRAKWREITAD